MGNILLYQQEGVSTLFLGEVEVGEDQPTTPVIVNGKNTSTFAARELVIGTNDPNVQLALAENGPWGAVAGPYDPIAPDGLFYFFARVNPPDVGQPHYQPFKFTIDYTSIP